MTLGARVLLACGVLAALLAFASVDKPYLRLATGKDFARISFVHEPTPRDRALHISGVLIDDAGNELWSRVSSVQLEGADDRKIHTVEWPLPHASPFQEGSRKLVVTASVVCASAESQAYVP